MNEGVRTSWTPDQCEALKLITSFHDHSCNIWKVLNVGSQDRASHQNKKLEYDLGLRTTINLWPTLLKIFLSEFSDPGLLPPQAEKKEKKS